MFNFHEQVSLQNKSNDILTIGEILIDMISEDYDDNFECQAYNRFFGGSPSNIAINTKRLGIHSLVVSAVGADGLGDFLKSQLRKVHIDTKCIQKVDYSTSMVVVTKSQFTPVPIFYRGADYQIEYTSILEDAIKDSKIIHFSCWPISMPLSRRTIEKSIDTARKNNALVCFDPNYHPMLWPKGEDGIEYVKSFIGNADIVKPSEVDAERIFGQDHYENQVEKFLELGAKLVIMTLGQDGAIVSNGKETLKFHTLAKEVVDTTGAGDAFWSGFYTAIVKGHTIKEALELGFAVSAFKLRYTGAVVELPRLEKIKEIYSL
ncbi:carbohydrate kinase family protein [Metabacillus endolithicus]|uniref:Carbohydrate kinase family protein n=1 Tax=Metabacillus endolithicus TaxID=1535204 RepID=A0ABW5BY16_9BACI|nr:carbohydrate kinase [Metabacillus endolithicus]UPG65492.1 carbohydrate kinase [Metabacillus endolithicus]